MLLLDAFHEGGVPMYPIMACGVALLVAAGRLAQRPDPRRLLVVQELRALTLVAGALGSLLGVMHTLVALFGVPQDQRGLLLARGASESINNIGLALVMTLLATVISAVAMARSARTPAL